jgi:hypothetical protein
MGKKDLSTVLICSACQGTLFTEKKHEGTILLHCANCGGSAKVAKCGIGFAVVTALEESGRVFPTVKEAGPAKEKKSEEIREFEILEFRLPPAVKAIAQAALWAAKCSLQVTGSWYGGVMLGHICADFLSGCDFSGFAPDDLKRITDLLQTAAEEVETNKENGGAFREWPAGFQKHAEEVVVQMVEGPLAFLPKAVADAVQVKEEHKAESIKESVGKAVQARKKKSFQRLETCVRGLDFQIREASASTQPEDGANLDYLNEALEKGANFLKEVKDGTKTLSDPQIQRFMKITEEKLGLRAPKDSDESEDMGCTP